MAITKEQWAGLARAHQNTCGLDGERLAAVLAVLEENDADYDAILKVFDKLLGTHGVEYVAHPNGDGGLDYCNAGDTYAVTLAYDDLESEFLITSWGAWMEAAEQEHEEENNVTRCWYCGEFYDNDGEPCHDEHGNTPRSR